MPTAILPLDVEMPCTPPRVDERYTRALIVVRRHHRPVGQFYVPVLEGAVDVERCEAHIQQLRSANLGRWRMEDYLGSGQVRPLLPSTVAICTRERPEDLAVALRAVTALTSPPAEILVVDNNPASDRTRAVAEQFSVRYVREDRRGLDAARNRALREATTDIVAFTDDDAAPQPDWLTHLLRPFDNPRVWCATGLTLPRELETPAQECFERHSPFGRGFERRLFDGTRDDPLFVARVGAGANMALRRRVLTDLGGFDEALDAGTITRSGGDHEMFGRILAAGHCIAYEPAAVSWHRHRRSWEELRETLYGYGVGVYAMWTRRLVVDWEPRVIRHALGWLRSGQLPALWDAVRRRPESLPIDLQLASLRGCLAGPRAYFQARRRLREAV